MTSEMTICGGLLVDRTAQIEHLDDTCRTEIEVLTDDLGELLIGNLAGTKGVYHDRSRTCDTDCVES